MHVAVTYGAGSLKMYVNGVLQRTVAQTGNLTATTGPLFLGGNSVFLDEFFSGVMTSPHPSVALPVADIRTLMRTPVMRAGCAPSIPRAWWRRTNFDDGTATDSRQAWATTAC